MVPVTTFPLLSKPKFICGVPLPIVPMLNPLTKVVLASILVIFEPIMCAFWWLTVLDCPPNIEECVKALIVLLLPPPIKSWLSKIVLLCPPTIEAHLCLI